MPPSTRGISPWPCGYWPRTWSGRTNWQGVTLHGRDAVGEYWRLQWAVLDHQFEMKHFELDANGHLVVTLVQTVRGLNGTAISQGLVRHIYAFENGLVRRMRVLL